MVYIANPKEEHAMKKLILATACLPLLFLYGCNPAVMGSAFGRASDSYYYQRQQQRTYYTPMQQPRTTTFFDSNGNATTVIDNGSVGTVFGPNGGVKTFMRY
jgi:hypothetical protein